MLGNPEEFFPLLEPLLPLEDAELPPLDEDPLLLEGFPTHDGFILKPLLSSTAQRCRFHPPLKAPQSQLTD